MARCNIAKRTIPRMAQRNRYKALVAALRIKFVFIVYFNWLYFL
jgi:hypothetical protein